MIETNEMLKDVIAFKTSGKDCLYFEVDDSSEIVVEILGRGSGNELEIAVEWRNSETNEVYEAAVCEYKDNAEIESVLDYIRRCALDGRCDYKKTSLSEQIQSASSRAAESQPTSYVKAKETEPEI